MTPRSSPPPTCLKEIPSVSRAEPFPPSSNRKRKWWRYFHPRVLKPGDAASGPPETEIDCFSHATSPEIDQMAPPLHRKWKHSTGKWTSGPRLSDTKKDLVSLSVCSTDCRVMFEKSGVEIPSRKLPCLPSFLCPPLPQPIPNHSIVISIKKVCISLDATTLITNYLFVPCTMYHVPCIMYSVPGTTYPVPCTMYYVPCTPNKIPTLPTCLGWEDILT